MHSLFSGDLDAGLGAAADLGADVVADADACSAGGGRADGEAWGAVGGGEEVEAVHLPQGGRCLCHSLKVSPHYQSSILKIQKDKDNEKDIDKDREDAVFAILSR